jgi:hypothetical protein
LVIKGDTNPKDQLWTGNDTSVFSSNAVPIGVWSHVAMTLNNNLTTYYLNGLLVAATNQDRGNVIDNSATSVAIGREQYTGALPAGRWFFNGQLDDVRIYDRALSQAEIQSVRMDSVSPPTPRIVDVVVSGVNLIFSGTNGTPETSYRVLASTNVATPPEDWTRIATNYFAGDGSFTITNTILSSVPAMFFLLQLAGEETN